MAINFPWLVCMAERGEEQGEDEDEEKEKSPRDLLTLKQTPWRHHHRARRRE